MIENLRRLLDAHPFFHGLAPEQVEVLVGCASNRVLPAGAMLFTEGAPADQFFLLRAGRVALEVHVPNRGPLVFETRDGDGVLGWSWLVPPYRWHFDARVVSEVRFLAFDAVCLRGKMDADPVLGYALMQRFLPLVVERLQATRVRMLDLFAQPGAPGRLHG